MNAHPYSDTIRQLFTLGRPTGNDTRFDLERFGITTDHLEELKRLVVDPNFNEGDSEDPSVYAPLYAWRALGELGDEGAIDTLIQLIDLNAIYDDDWIPSDLPDVFAKIGPASLKPLIDYASQRAKSEWSRTIAFEAIAAIGNSRPYVKTQSIALLSHQLQAQLDIHDKDFNEADGIVTSQLMVCLISLQAVEAAPLIKDAFAADRIDPSIAGDWEDVQVELGLLPGRQTPSLRYFRLPEERSAQKSAQIVQKQSAQPVRADAKQQHAMKKNKRKQEAKSRKQNRKKK